MTYSSTLSLLLRLLLVTASVARAGSPSFAGEWAYESPKEPPCLFLQPDGRAGLAAICIGALGRWHYDARHGRVMMDLKDGDGRVTHYILKPSGPKILAVESPADFRIWHFYKTPGRTIH